MLAIAIILAIQVAVAAPFLEYFGGKTSLKTYLLYSKLLGGNPTDEGRYGRGALFQYSIYWTFLTSEMYYSDLFPRLTLFSTLALNVYHFFIKKRALPTCLQNLIKPLSSSDPFSDSQIRFSVECIFLGQMIGCMMCPGGHFQFQFWYSYMMPLLIQLLPLPQFIKLILYQSTTPADHEVCWVHHGFILLMTLWLITVGPAAVFSKMKRE